MQAFKPDKTKIIATIGPSSESEEKMRQLVLAGVDVFRFNLKHNSLDWHQEKIEQVVRIEQELGTAIGVLVDLQGPELRTKTSNNIDIAVTEGTEVTFIPQKAGTYTGTYIIMPDIAFETLSVDDVFVLDDGYVTFRVTEKNDAHLIATSQNDYVIKTNKSLNIQQKDLPIPSLTENDLEKLALAKRTRADFVALSFVRSKEDVLTLRNAMEERDIHADIVAKVESQKGVDNIDEIIEHADVIMIARGDLGIETPIESVTYFQKETIKKCREHSKPVIVATQMLESMIHAPIPTRAEAADVANAVFDRTDCVMLSGETASGKYPVEAAKTMSRIIAFNEARLEYKRYEHAKLDTTSRIAQAAVSLTNSEDVHKIISLTETGYTARIIAALRPNKPIITVSPSIETLQRLAVCYGIQPVTLDASIVDTDSYQPLIDELMSRGLVTTGETVIIIHGQQLGVPGHTNTLVIVTV